VEPLFFGFVSVFPNHLAFFAGKKNQSYPLLDSVLLFFFSAIWWRREWRYLSTRLKVFSVTLPLGVLLPSEGDN